MKFNNFIKILFLTFIGIFIYLIVKVNNDYGWHYGDIIGLFLLAFLPGALFIGALLENIKK